MEHTTKELQEQLAARLIEIRELEEQINVSRAYPPHHNFLLRRRKQEILAKEEAFLAQKQASFAQDFGKPAQDFEEEDAPYDSIEDEMDTSSESSGDEADDPVLKSPPEPGDEADDPVLKSPPEPGDVQPREAETRGPTSGAIVIPRELEKESTFASRPIFSFGHTNTSRADEGLDDLFDEAALGADLTEEPLPTPEQDIPVVEKDLDTLMEEGMAKAGLSEHVSQAGGDPEAPLKMAKAGLSEEIHERIQSSGAHSAMGGPRLNDARMCAVKKTPPTIKEHRKNGRPAAVPAKKSTSEPKPPRRRVEKPAYNAPLSKVLRATDRPNTTIHRTTTYRRFQLADGSIHQADARALKHIKGISADLKRGLWETSPGQFVEIGEKDTIVVGQDVCPDMFATMLSFLRTEKFELKTAVNKKDWTILWHRVSAHGQLFELAKKFEFTKFKGAIFHQMQKDKDAFLELYYKLDAKLNTQLENAQKELLEVDTELTNARKEVLELWTKVRDATPQFMKQLNLGKVDNPPENEAQRLHGYRY